MINNGLTAIDTLTIKTAKILPPDQVFISYSSLTTLKMRWRNNYDAATEFIIYKNETDSFTVTTNSFDDSNINPNITNIYRIKAKSPFEETELSDTITAIYKFVPPVLQDPVRGDSTDIILNWSDLSTAEDGYRIYRSVNSLNLTDFQLIAELPADSTQFIDKSIKTIGLTYSYYIQNYKDTQVFNSNIKSILLSDIINLFYDFENNNGGFTSSTWEYGHSLYNAHSGDKVWGVQLDSNYPSNSAETLYMPSITLKNNNSVLSFYQFVNAESGYDYAYVLISNDDGNSWDILVNTNGISSYSGQYSDWDEVTYNLNAYNGQTIKIRFLFISDNIYETACGWLIDDVSLISE